MTSRVAIGANGSPRLITSDDLTTWTDRTFGSSGAVWGLAHQNSLWVAVGAVGYIGGNALVTTSPDAETWTQRAADADYPIYTVNRLRDVAWNGTEWIAIGDLHHFTGGTPDYTLAVLASSDGVTWTVRDIWSTPNPTSGDPLPVGMCIGWGGGLWVVGLETTIGSGSPAILTSPDGTTWTAQSSPFDAGPPPSPRHGGLVNGVAYGAGLWVAVGRGTKAIATSPDGATWTARSSPITDDDTIASVAVAWNGSVFVVGGTDGTGTDPMIVTSTDGLTWTAPTTPISSFSDVVDLTWDSIGGQWVVLVDDFSNPIVASPDASTWTSYTEPISVSQLRTVTAGPAPAAAGGWAVGQIRMGN